MIFDSRQAAERSLREFSPLTRARHKIVGFYSTSHNRMRYARVFA